MGKPHGPPAKSIVTGRRPYWTAEEDAQLVRLVKKYGTKNWGIIAKELHSPIPRKGKSCRCDRSLDAATRVASRSRWMHQLNPCIKHEPFSVEEERVLIAKQREFGNKWSKIAAYLPGRTDNAIKNHWHGHVKRRLSTVRGDSSDEEDLMLEMKSEEPWNEAVEVYPVPLLRSRWKGGVTSSMHAQEMECARILLELSQAQQSPRPLPAVTSIKREALSEGESESSKEPNNGYTSRALLESGPSKLHEENNNSAEMIQPDQQKILSQTLHSAGLGHYSVLPLCPIREEDINSDHHVVIVLQGPTELPHLDSCSGGAAVCPEAEPWRQSASEFRFYDSPEGIREMMRENISAPPSESKAVHFLQFARKFDSSSSRHPNMES